MLQYGKSDTFGGIKEISTSLSKSTYDLEISGLDDGTKYFYRLNTFDEDGNEYPGSTVLTFTTPARPRIENLRFQPIEGEPTSSQKLLGRLMFRLRRLLVSRQITIQAKKSLVLT